MDYKTRKSLVFSHKREKWYKLKDKISLSFSATTNHVILNFLKTSAFFSDLEVVLLTSSILQNYHDHEITISKVY